MHPTFSAMLARRYIDVHNKYGADAAQDLAERTVGDDEELKDQVREEINRLLEEIS